MKSYPLICLVTFLLSLVNEAFRPANSTAIAFYSKEENRTRSYSLNRLAINLGWALGGAIGGILASVKLPIGQRPMGFAFHWPALLCRSLILASKRVIGENRPDYF